MHNLPLAAKKVMALIFTAAVITFLFLSGTVYAEGEENAGAGVETPVANPTGNIIIQSTTSGITYQVYNGDTYADSSVQITVVTDGTGTATVTELQYGTYHVANSSSPIGYTVDSTIYDVELAEGFQEITVSSSIDQVPGRISLEVYDQDTKKHPVQGAYFEIRMNGPSGAVADTCGTGTTGAFTSNDLPWGTYCIVQSVVPDGYNAADPIYFSIGSYEAGVTTELPTAYCQINSK